MSTIELNNLWTYIESIGLSNKNRKWLADKLVEPTKAEMPNAKTLAAMRELESGKDAGSVDASSVEAFVASML